MVEAGAEIGAAKSNIGMFGMHVETRQQARVAACCVHSIHE